MSQNEGIRKLKAALLLTFVVDFVYGLGFFFMPGYLSSLAGGTPVEHGWLRWSGGVLLGLAAGALHAYRDPVNQKSVVTLLTAAPLLSGLAFTYTLLFDSYSIHAWFILMPCIVVFVMFAAMLRGRQAAREVLE